MVSCFLCSIEINESNDSKEHVFLNCIGGKRTVTKFICIKCNSDTGRDWDNEVDKSTSMLALIFKIKRHRGIVQSKKITSSCGVVHYIHENSVSSDELEHYVVDDKIIIKGPSKARVEQYKKKLIKEGIIPKEIRSEGFSQEIEFSTVRFRQEFNSPPCNSNFSKSLVKSAVAFLASELFDISKCNLAKDYLVNGGKCCVNYAYDYVFQGSRPFGVPFHYLRVYNNDNVIYAYFEMYGFIRYIISLSDIYDGKDILFTYAIDPTKGETIEIDCIGLRKLQSRHPAKLQLAILNEFNFSKGLKRALFSNWDKIIDDCCLTDYSQFLKLIIEPLNKYALEEIHKREKKEDALYYLNYFLKTFPELNKLAIQCLKVKFRSL